MTYRKPVLQIEPALKAVKSTDGNKDSIHLDSVAAQSFTTAGAYDADE